ncbi:MAG: DUF2007 domain-containing protein [Muribaculaceae bacterium]|nr:DUF2007 domain-containing protein [Muribaculaceae bacterium]
MNTLSSHSTLVTLNVYNSDAEAYIAKGLLESNGIKCIVDNEIMSTIYPIPFSTIGQVRLMVLQRDENMAREILANNLPLEPIED